MFWWIEKHVISLSRNQNRYGCFRKEKMERLTYSTKEINRNFKIKVSGMYEGKKLHTLVGVSGMLKLIGDIDLTNRLLDRAFNSREDKCSCKLRRGIRVDFYVY